MWGLVLQDHEYTSFNHNAMSLIAIGEMFGLYSSEFITILSFTQLMTDGRYSVICNVSSFNRGISVIPKRK